MPPKEMTHIRDEINRVTQSRRMLAHGLVTPAARPGRSRLHGPAGGDLKVDAWKAYTGACAQGVRSRLVRRRREDRLPDARAGPQARHQALLRAQGPAAGAGGRLQPSARLIKAAKDFPDIDFLLYHSGLLGVTAAKPTGEVPWTTEFCEMKKKEPGLSNIYMELGSTFGQLVTTNPTACAHLLGPGHRRLRRRSRAVGHRLDLVRHAAVADRGVPALRDSRRADRQARVRAAHARGEGADLRAQRARACSGWT